MNLQQPDLLTLILEYLSDVLPSPLYTLLVKVLSHSFAALTAIRQLCTSLLSNNPANWNAQVLLPPIITIVVAYLALLSLYRTTSWLIRLIFWCLKWGSLFGVFMAGVGYFIGNGNGNAVRVQGALPVLENLFSTLFDDKDGLPRSRQKKSRKHKPKSQRPKPWESFNVHEQWQYQENQEPGEDPHLQKVIDMATGAVGKIFTGQWWTVENVADKPKSDSTKTKAPAGRSRSR
ncbi:hypothetical protein JR316_0002176 [Psilocybe cubensis]|nr:hypothetical protein JR316_0002176 [Psilocybe cubensis]KAH9485269.1 hypothetical protein JR316_0002176 [Psilocybe cubensis]